jgi:hypothetical protein
MVRQIIEDLEKGDLCAKNIKSYLTDIKNLKNAIEAKDSVILISDRKIEEYKGIIDEKNTQLDKKESIITATKIAVRGRMIKSFIGGTAAGAIIGVILML